MRLFLHIGLHKTGTTAIQYFMYQNAALLRNAGYLYPQTGLLDKAHHKLGMALLPNNEPGDWWSMFLREWHESACQNAVLSTESLEYLRDDDGFARLGRRLKGIDIKIVVYLRRQDHFLTSSYAQDVKARRFTCDIDTYYQETLSRYDYYQLLERWASRFGQEHIIVRVYEKEQLPDGLHKDFIGAIGLHWMENFEELSRRPNPSLDDYGVRIMRVANDLVKDDNELADFRQRLIEETQNASTSGSLLLTGAQRHEILATYADSNAHVAREYLGRADGRLFNEETPKHTGELEDSAYSLDQLIALLLRIYQTRKHNHR